VKVTENEGQRAGIKQGLSFC